MKILIDATFKKQVLEASIPVVVDFWAPWCGPCRMLAPVVEEASVILGSEAHFYSMNIDENPLTPSEYGVLSIPTLMLFWKGELVDTRVGIQTLDSLVAWVKAIPGS